MSKNAKIVGVGLLVALIGAAVWFFAIRKADAPTAKVPVADTRSGAIPESALTTAGSADDSQARSGELPPTRQTMFDVDPVGTLQLDGQVVDSEGEGVGGAEVWLSSNPPRNAVTELDGSFTFDKLVQRSYSVQARVGDRVGGPVPAIVPGDPVVIRLVVGMALEVLVTDEAGALQPGIEVGLASMSDRKETTDKDGLAKFSGVAAGWTVVTTKAQKGFAPSGSTVTVSSGGKAEVTLVLKRGVAVSGRVVSENGSPVKDAKVTAESSGMWSRFSNDAVDVNDQGEFTLTVAPGSYHVSALAKGFAPGASDVFTVGEQPVSGKVVTLQPGAVLSGRVITAAGAAAPFATIRVGKKVSGTDWGASGDVRQATADETGAFTIDSLARAPLSIIATNELAGSQAIDVDFTSTLERRDVVISLDVVGTIAGIVVDSAGEPVAEVSVSAVPDIWKGGSINQLMLRGPGQATTGGDGKFVINALAEGDYRVSASRNGGQQMWQGGGMKGASAHTGDTNVRVELPTPGGVVGKLVLDNGDAPTMAVAAIGWSSTSKVVKGIIDIADLAPGTVDIVFRGSEFGDYTKTNVVVEPGKITDIGTVTVPRARKLRGRVVSSKGQPVAGAKVMIGRMLFSNGDSAGFGDENIETSAGIRTAKTADDGTFTIIGIPTEGTNVMADSEAGRSLGVVVPAGADDPPTITLTLRNFGTITGKVTRAGEPMSGYQIAVTNKDSAAAQVAMVTSGPDGSFRFTRIPEGAVAVQAMPGSQGMSMSATSVDATVIAGKSVEVNIAVAAGDVTLSVTVKGKDGAQIDAAQIFLVKGVAGFKTGKDISTAFTSGGMVGMQFAMGGNAASFPELLPGAYSVCTIPINGDLNDPTYMQRIMREGDSLAVYCVQYEVKAAPKEQTFVHEVPPMTPLP